MKKGYIFDMDGTLLDSLHAWDNLGNRYLESLGIQGNPHLDEIMKHMSLDEAASYMIERFHLHTTVSELIKSIRQMMTKAYEEDIPLKAGMEDFLKMCHNNKSQMCILTASDSQLGKRALKRLHILDYFQDVYVCHEIGFPKTDGQSYSFVAKQMGLKNSECAVVEDSLHAIMTAKKAGFYVIGVYDKGNDKDWQDIVKIADEVFINDK